MGEPVVVVSNDTHIGPRLVEDLRDAGMPIRTPVPPSGTEDQWQW
jgi:hypothetical protein